MRKLHLDNIRWITILLVVIFHSFYYYNNIGIKAMFAGAPAYNDGMTFAGIFQYFVYPWFMLLLFVVAGMSAKYALEKKTVGQFIKARTDKLLVPSTLGVLAFGWIGGFVIYLTNASINMPKEVPGFVRLVIVLFSGIGALWFCHVPFTASLLLAVIRKIVAKYHGNDTKTCQWFARKADKFFPFCVLLIFVYLILWGGAHVLNMPLITAYRNGIYIPAFLFGYYIFSNEEIIEKLKKAVFLFFILSVLTGGYYISRCYGLAYSDIYVLSRWDLNLYAFFMILFVLGAGARFLDFRNAFTDYMNQSCFGIYVLHIPVMLVINYLLIGKQLPIIMVYSIEFIGSLIFSILLYEVIHRIPVLRYWIFGVRKNRPDKKTNNSLIMTRRKNL